ncbi:glycoside hydrolase 15 protein [Paramarasmius palmivorus]|uniref:glucan 1,4-alpha-glucosidase n=1 Tax=Paramarasmius palmivorus TaxID=297713 RepID=A0AAW0BMV7_9AGAR
MNALWQSGLWITLTALACATIVFGRTFDPTLLTHHQSALTQRSIDEYIKKEMVIAKAGVLANIGPDGKRSSNAKASPSTDPDYLYTWTRDSSLVFKMLIDQYTQGRDISLRETIDNFVAAESYLQSVTNPSGNITTGGLAEPKFNINLTAFEGSWGRPQGDGPALRATALITYGNWLISAGRTGHVREYLLPAITNDLEYVADHWNQSTFDLWEEVQSSSFFTIAVQHRALREGVSFAHRLGISPGIVNVKKYHTQAENALRFLQTFWNPSKSYITSNTGGGRSGIDSNSILATIHTFDPNAGCDAITFQPCSDKALANLKVYVDSFRKIYTINAGIPENEAVATGRYPEDVCIWVRKPAVAQQLYYALTTWKHQGFIEITSVSLPFFQQFSSSVDVGNYPIHTDTYKTLVASIQSFADGFIEINARYTPSDGSLAEQFDEETGEPLSAKDLTWSYASAVTALEARDGNVPVGWGGKEVCR